jgi:hypothetical protein
MTPQQTIEILKLMQAEVEWEYTMDYAVAIDEAIKALEKQIPKEVIYKPYQGDEDFPVAHCPNCDELQPDRWEGEQLYCMDCGQRLKWSDSK